MHHHSYNNLMWYLTLAEILWKEHNFVYKQSIDILFLRIYHIVILLNPHKKSFICCPQWQPPGNIENVRAMMPRPLITDQAQDCHPSGAWIDLVTEGVKTDHCWHKPLLAVSWAVVTFPDQLIFSAVNPHFIIPNPH